MKDILVTGYSRILKGTLLDDLAKDFRIVAADSKLSRRKDGPVRFYSIDPGEDAFSQLFDVYSFSAVFFISGYVDGCLLYTSSMWTMWKPYSITTFPRISNTTYTESDVPDAQEGKAVPLPLFPTGKCTV